MCGIALIIDKNKKTVDTDVLTAMTDKVRHRGPDGSGVYVEGEVGLGHRRLAIIDLSETGKQPMFFDEAVIVYNGEIYNYIELREELKELGYKFHSQSDTEVLLAAYRQWGEDCVKKLRGMWAFVLFDQRKRTVFLSRDRFGIKPLHYANTPTKFLAGSEIKQFNEISDFEPRMYHPIVYEFLQNSVLNHNEYTFYQDVYSLPAGHNMVYDLKDQSTRITRWYSLEDIPVKTNGSIQEAAGRFRKVFEDAVKIHLRSDVRLGSCLSGGMDSSSIVCTTRELLGEQAPIYTITSCNDNASFDEREYAKAVSDHCHTNAILTTPDLNALYSEQLLEKITWHQDQPILSGSHFAEYNVFEEARKNNLIVMLDGQGSDEYLAGYHNFFLFRCLGLLRKGKFSELRRTIKERAASRGLTEKSIYIDLAKMTLRRNIGFLRKGNRKIASWVDPDWAQKHRDAPGATFANRKQVDNLHELSLMAMQTTSIPYQLHSEDRNSMTFSIESRVPFLDHLLVETTMGLPEDNYFEGGLDKMPLREGLKDILPDKIYNRRTKLGFASSDEIWMKQNSTQIRERLNAAVEYFKGIIHPNLIQEFDDYAAGKRGYNNVFFRVLALYAWARATKIRLN